MSVFCDFGVIFGGPGAPGPAGNSPKIAQDTQKVDFGMRLGRIFFGRRVWGGFREDFEMILAGFWKDFG